MAHLQRVIVAALLLFSSWFPSSSFASFPAVSVPGTTEWQMVYGYNSQPVTGQWYSSAVAACTAAAAAVYTGGWYGSWGFTGPGECAILNSSGSYTGNKFYAATRTTSASYTCPSNSTLSVTVCVCSSGFVESGSSCVDPNAAKCAAAKGGSDLFTDFTSFPGVGSAFCPSDGAASSCASVVTGGFGIVKNGAKVWTIDVEYSGSTCTPPTSGTVGAETGCKGTVGTVNGVTVCSPPSDRNTVQSIKSTTATNPVDPASAPGSGGSTATQEATTCTGSKCSTTTTTTTTPAGGGAATVTVKTEDVPKDDYCRDNPRAIMCLTSSFGGACAGGFTCEGDAVQCATAREIHTRNCRMFDQDSPESLLYGTEKNKAGSQVANENVAISSANFDTSDAIGGSGACITDKVVTVMGSPITIPFSGVCVHLAMLGNVLLTVSFLLAGRIFMRG